MPKEPVCGMDVPEKGAKHMLHYGNETLISVRNSAGEIMADGQK